MTWKLLIVIAALILITVAPSISPYDPLKTDADNQLQPPSIEHWLGTDLFGRDLLSRMLHGTQQTILSTTFATTIAVLPGLVIGSVSAISSKNVQRFSTNVTNTLLALPGLLIALVILTLIGSGTFQIAIAGGLAQVAPYSRVIRAAILTARSSPCVEASNSMGATQKHLIIWHLLPLSCGTLAAYTAVTFSYCLASTAALTFLGFGGQPGTPDWGLILAEGRQVIRLAPWVGFAPGVAITLTVMLANNLADWLGDSSLNRR